MSDGAATTVPVLECRGLRKTYVSGPLEVPVLMGVDLTVARGERVAIVGASGSGRARCCTYWAASTRRRSAR